MTEDFNTRLMALFHDWNYPNPFILYGLIRSLRPHTVVEVGTYRGFAACLMAKALKDNGDGTLYCIDNFSLRDHEWRYGDAKAHFFSNLEHMGVREQVVLLEGNSDQVDWPRKVDFAYIDGWHSYNAVKYDFERCRKLGAECIALDDTVQSVGPRLFVQELVDGENDEPFIWHVITMNRVCGMSICMREQELGKITFSQELPNNPGVDLQKLTKQEMYDHFEEATEAGGHDWYRDNLEDALCDGVPEE